MSATFVLSSALLALSAAAASVVDPRYCGAPERGPDGRIARSAEVVRDFRALYPCPATGRTRGSCPGWAVDHVVPLACGGCDAVGNLQWLPTEAKSAAGTWPKDRWERAVYCNRRAP